MGTKSGDNKFDVVIIGAGGAGMMCARTAALRGKRVLLIDHASALGRKILISGGGRCNFTNLYANAECYVSQNPHFAKSALARYTPGDFIQLVEKHKIAYHEKKLGQLFCDESAQSIVDLLVNECKSAGATFLLNCHVEAILPPAELEGMPAFKSKQTEPGSNGYVRQPGHFSLATNRGTIYGAAVVVATGGLSVPKVGATGFGYDVARAFGLSIVQTAPALDGFVMSDKDLRHYKDLQGVAADSVVSCGGASFRENILFTHRGLSGPASLQASLYWHQGLPVTIDLCPDIDIGARLKEERAEGARQNIKNVLSDWMPKRLAHRFCDDLKLDDSLQHISDKAIDALADAIANWKIKPASTVGFIKAEVTRGGVDTDELSSRTMECKKIPGLYFIGEVVDVTGWLGGYNFQWAWASGFAAGESV